MKRHATGEFKWRLGLAHERPPLFETPPETGLSTSVGKGSQIRSSKSIHTRLYEHRNAGIIQVQNLGHSWRMCTQAIMRTEGGNMQPNGDGSSEKGDSKAPCVESAEQFKLVRHMFISAKQRVNIDEQTEILRRQPTNGLLNPNKKKRKKTARRTSSTRNHPRPRRSTQLE
jgi:hypothetical protein